MMRFSARVSWNLAENGIQHELARAHGEGRPIVDLTETNPTRVGLREPSKIEPLLARSGAISYDPSAFGLASARESVAEHLRAAGVPSDPDAMFLTASTSEAYAWIFKLLCNPGDDVLVPQPSYPLFEYLAGIESVRARPYFLAREDGFRLDVAAIARDLQPTTRAIVVVHPNNPTGTLIFEEDAVALERIAEERGVAIVSDEVFRDHLFYGVPPGRRRTFAGERGGLTFVLGGLSKSCAAPGLKLAFTTVHGRAATVRAALDRLEVIADTFLSVGTPIQLALPDVLALQPSIRREILARLHENLGTMDRAVADFGVASGVRRLGCDGGWNAVLEIPRTKDEETWVRELLKEDGVRVHPGYFFDMQNDGYLVVSLLPEPERFAAAIRCVVQRVSRG